MNILFVHNNFPAQFRHIAAALVEKPDIKVAAIGCPTAQAVSGVQLIRYNMGEANVASTHPFARRFDMECRRAEQVLYSLTSLLSSGFEPDVIVVHPGWGENLPLRGVFPNARIIAYFEFYYGLEGRDVRFDPEFPMMGTDGDILVQIKNASSLLALSDCDHGFSPTAWQRSTFPKEYLNKIDVIHEGIDVDLVKPDPKAAFKLPSGRILTRKDEVVTYVTRNFEPLRGCHIFFRSLPRILKERPNAEIILVGGDAVSYGAHPPPGKTWKSIFFDEVKTRLDTNRVHFTGILPYAEYLKVLQISSAHIYLTYPFVTSWSLMEAMSAGCVVIGSDTSPVREVIEDGQNGYLVPFFDIDLLSERVIQVLRDRRHLEHVRINARRSMQEHYDMKRRCVPKLMSLLTGQPVEIVSASKSSSVEKPEKKVRAMKPEPVPPLAKKAAARRFPK